MAMKSIANPDLYTRAELKASKNEAYGHAAIVTWESNSIAGDIATIVYNIAYAVSDKGTFNKGYILDDVEPLILQYFKLTGEDIQDYHNKVEEL